MTAMRAATRTLLGLSGVAVAGVTSPGAGA